jgi:aspartyl-tRNA synthetase
MEVLALLAGALIFDAVFGFRCCQRLVRTLELGYWTIRLKASFDVEVFTKLVERYGQRLPDLRPVLKVKDFPLFGSPVGHTHGAAAAERTSMNAQMARKVLDAGREPYHVSMSRADQARGESGSRLFFWDKDLKTAARSDIIDDNHVMICTDVDYYLDMGYQMGYGIP